MKPKKKILLLLSMFVLTFGCSLNALAAETNLVSVSAGGSTPKHASTSWLSCSNYSKIRFVYNGEEQGVSGRPSVSATVKYSDGTTKIVLNSQNVEGVSNGSTTYTLEKTSGTFQITVSAYPVKDDSHDEGCDITAYGESHTHSWATAWTYDSSYHWHKCNNGCSEVSGKAAHSYTVDSGVQYSAATCTAPRYNYKKCACGYNPQSSSYIVATGSALGHNWQTATTSVNNGLRSSATCTAPATYYQKCSRCSAKDNSKYNNVGSAKGHSYTYMPDHKISPF